jgi:hypothetical protein
LPKYQWFGARRPWWLHFQARQGTEMKANQRPADVTDFPRPRSGALKINQIYMRTLRLVSEKTVKPVAQG